MKSLPAVSLFSNCGAGDVGFRRAGFKFVVMAELDERRLDVALQNHPKAHGVVGDLRETWREVVECYRLAMPNSRPALLSACPPCQGMSSARSGKGSHDDPEAGSKDRRNLLVTVISKVTKRLSPDIVVVENVPAFFSRQVWHPRTRNPISAANLLLEYLSPQYEPFPLLTDLSNYGVPQTRKRAFLTFVRKGNKGLLKFADSIYAPYPKPTHDGMFGRPRPITLDEALHSFALPSLDAKSATKAARFGSKFGGLHCVPVWSDRVYKMVAAIPKHSGRSAWENDRCERCGKVCVTERTVKCPKCRRPLLRPIVQEEDGTYRLIAGFRSSYRRMRGDRPASTVTTASGHIGSDNAIHPFENRLLSPLECALLQTFPEDFKWGTALECVGGTGVRDMIGEAVPPLFTELHGRVLRGLLLDRWAVAPIPARDERCLRAWASLRREDKLRRPLRTKIAGIRTSAA